DVTPDVTSMVGGATRREYRDPQGQTRVESWTVANLGHGTAIDPSRGCGGPGPFLLDVQLCSSRFAAEFFGLVSTAAPDAGVGADGGSRTDAGGFVCRDFTAMNGLHVGALRAAACGPGSANVCTVGAGDDLGPVAAVTTVREVAPGYFERGTCAGSAGGGGAGGGEAGGTVAGGGAGAAAGGSAAGGQGSTAGGPGGGSSGGPLTPSGGGGGGGGATQLRMPTGCGCSGGAGALGPGLALFVLGRRRRRGSVA
ncbi:MAG: hypothetical protein INH37_06750, partial [Myxococcaceae bacterium]|nr:hypothetical protein [Myxococcaceae bacterium]